MKSLMITVRKIILSNEVDILAGIELVSTRLKIVPERIHTSVSQGAGFLILRDS